MEDMLLNLLSDKFLFEAGDVAAIPCSVLLNLSERVWDRVVIGQITNNSVDLTSVVKPGRYLLQMGDLGVQRAPDRPRVRVPYFGTLLAVTQDDLERGYCDLVVKAEKLFKVTVTDRSLRPIKKAKIMFLDTDLLLELWGNAEAPGMRAASMGVQADEDGVVFFLRYPGWVHMESGMGLVIVTE